MTVSPESVNSKSKITSKVSKQRRQNAPTIDKITLYGTLF